MGDLASWFLFRGIASAPIWRFVSITGLLSPPEIEVGFQPSAATSTTQGILTTYPQRLTFVNLSCNLLVIVTSLRIPHPRLRRSVLQRLVVVRRPFEVEGGWTLGGGVPFAIFRACSVCAFFSTSSSTLKRVSGPRSFLRKKSLALTPMEQGAWVGRLTQKGLRTDREGQAVVLVSGLFWVGLLGAKRNVRISRTTVPQRCIGDGAWLGTNPHQTGSHLRNPDLQIYQESTDRMESCEYLSRICTVV